MKSNVYRTHMNLPIKPLLFLLLLADAVQAQPTRFLVNPVTPPASIQNAISKGTRTADGRPGASYWQQFAMYSIDATVDTTSNTLRGSVTIRYTNNSPDTLAQLHLDLYQNVHAPGVIRNEPAEVTGGVSLHGVSVAGVALQPATRRGTPGYVVNGTRLVLMPSSPAAPGSTTVISIDYSFVIPQAGAGSRMGYDAKDLYYLAYWYPQMTVYDDIQGWHPDPFQQNAEFYHGFADYEITFRMPGDWMVIGTGELTNPGEVFAPHVLERYNAAMNSDDVVHIITKDDFGSAGTAAQGTEMLTWRFSSKNVRDVAISLTRKSMYDGARATNGENYVRIGAIYRDSAPLWKESVRYSQHSITYFSKLTGVPYPWPHMTAVEAAQIIGGGMEYPMMTLIGDYNRAGAVALQSVIAHEIAHMWIPMIISTDERRYGWIDEGFTSFHDDMAVEDFWDQEKVYLNSFRGYFGIAGREIEGEMMRRSDFHYNSFAYRIASYSKPAAVLVALRGVLGDAEFLRINRKMFQTWKYKHMSAWDLFAFFNTESGQDLSWFWRPWYFATGVLDQGVVALTDRGRTTTIRLRDNGQNPMPYLLRLTLRDGSTHDVRFEASVVISKINDKNEFEVSVPYRNVVKVEIDADQVFPDVNRANNVFER